MQKLWVALVLASAATGFGADRVEQEKPAKTALESLVEKLGDKQERVRFEAALDLGRMGAKAQPAVGELAKLLKDPSPDVRAAAAQGLGGIGPAAKEAIPALLDALTDRSMTPKRVPVWVPVSFALGKIGPEAVPPLVKMLEKPDRQSRIAAASALGEIGPAAKDAVGPLVAILEKNDPPTRTAMIAGLMGIGREAKAAVPVLITMLDSDDFHTQYWAQRALAKIGPEARPAVPKLIELLSRGAVSVRRHSAIALGEIGPGIGQEGLDALVQALGDPMDPVREDAVVALGKLGDFAKPAVPAVRKALQTHKVATQVPTARTLWILTHDADAVVPALVQVIQEDPLAAVAAAEALGEMGPAAKKAAPALSVAVVQGDPTLRAAAMKALEKISPEEKKEK